MIELILHLREEVIGCAVGADGACFQMKRACIVHGADEEMAGFHNSVEFEVDAGCEFDADEVIRWVKLVEPVGDVGVVGGVDPVLGQAFAAALDVELEFSKGSSGLLSDHQLS